ncbi:MAG: hypothetical protein MUC97_15235 [Bernardetiaceae bacterium]|jgi:hypothetical protein|nr:hypothetical protein [Bernardetiaceae bacterium]
MKHLPLLPNRFKIVGWVLLLPFTVLGLLRLIDYEKIELSWLEFSRNGATFLEGGGWLFNLRYNNFTDELVSLGLLLGLSLVAFARTRTEDEWTVHLRLSAWLWSIIANTVLVALAIALIYNEQFVTAMTVNLFSVLFFFIIRFEYLLWRDRRNLRQA